MKTRWLVPIRFALFILAIFAFIPLQVLAAQVGKFTSVEGNVDVTVAGKAAKRVSVGDGVQVGDIIRTKSKSKCEVAFTDGNILRFAENTRLRITEYLIEQGQRKEILNLDRGKIRNMVQKAAQATGFSRNLKYEVHTPTAVLGVRGTDFVSYHLNGVTGATFKEGAGYGYTHNQPQIVQTITANQTMLAASPDQPPLVRPATAMEMGQHLKDTEPEKKTEQEEGKKEGREEQKSGTLTSGNGEDDKNQGKEQEKEEDKGKKEEQSNRQGGEESENGNSAKADQGKSANEGGGGDSAPGDAPGVVEASRTADDNEQSKAVDIAAKGDSDSSSGTTSTSTTQTTTSGSPSAATSGTGIVPDTSFDPNVAVMDGTLSSSPVSTTTTSASPLTSTPENSSSLTTNQLPTIEKLVESQEVKPQLEITLVTETPSETNSTEAAFTFQSTGAAAYAYRVDGGEWVNTSQSSVFLSNLEEKQHTIEAVAIDGAGNKSASKSYTWTTDYTPPTVAFSSEAAVPAGKDQTRFKLNVSGEDASPIKYSYRIYDNGATPPDYYTAMSPSSELDLSGHASGSFTLDVKGTDGAGNESSLSTLSFDLSRYAVTGDVGLTGFGASSTGTIYGGEVAGISGQNWGSWILDYTGTGAPGAAWQIDAGGASEEDRIYWLSSAAGTDHAGESLFHYLSENKTGCGNGTITVFDTTNNTWQARNQGIGRYTETPVAFSSILLQGEVRGRTNFTSGYYHYNSPDLNTVPAGWYYYSYLADGSYGYSDYRRYSAGYNSTTGRWAEYAADGMTVGYDYLAGSPLSGNWKDSHADLEFLRDAPAEGIMGETSIELGQYRGVTFSGSPGEFSGMLAGPAGLWTATESFPVSVMMMGRYAGQDAMPSVWTGSMYSNNFQENNTTTRDGGAYYALTGGTAYKGKMAGMLLGLYINPTGGAGYLKGSLEGSTYPSIGMFDLSGSAYTVPVTDSIGIKAADLASHVWNSDDFDSNGFYYGYYYPYFYYEGYGNNGSVLSGNFNNGGTLKAEDAYGYHHFACQDYYCCHSWWYYGSPYERGNTVTAALIDDTSHKTLPWGIFGQQLVGTMDNPGATWTARIGGQAVFGAHSIGQGEYSGVPDGGIWLAVLPGGTLADGKLSGTMNGRFISSTLLGTINAKLQGIQDEEGESFVAISGGTWQGESLKFFSPVYVSGTNSVPMHSGSYSYSDGSSYDYSYSLLSREGHTSYDQNGKVTFADYYPDGTTYTYTNDYPEIQSESRGTWKTGEFDLSSLASNPNDEEPLSSNAFDYYDYSNSSWGGFYMGGKTSLWYDTEGTTIPPTKSGIPVTLLGTLSSCYNGDLAKQSVWMSNYGYYYTGPLLYSYNALAETSTDYDGGAYAGYLGGIRKDDQMEGRLVALYIDPQGNAGYLKGSMGGAAGVGKYYDDIQMVEMDGTIDRTQVKAASAVNTAPEYLPGNIVNDYLDVKLGIRFNDGRKIGACAEGLSSRISGQDWGIYGVSVYGGYNFSTTEDVNSWSGRIGGSNFDGGSGGYWLAAITDGTWSNNLFQGMISGRYLTSTTRGDVNGELLGTCNDAYGTWQAVSLGTYGTYEAEPLTYSSMVSGSSYYLRSGSEFTFDYERVNGIMGGLDSNLWTPQGSEITFLGQFDMDSSATVPSIFSGDLVSFNPGLTMNPYDNTTSPLGGAYFGAIGGSVYNNGTTDSAWKNSLKGSIYTLYVDPDGNVGILKGSLTGSAYPQIYSWEAEGTWTPVQMASGITGIEAGKFHDGDYGVIQTAEWQKSCYDGQIPSATTAEGGLIRMGAVETREARINVPALYGSAGVTPWGIIRTIQGGSYDTFSNTKTPLGNFEMSFEGHRVQVEGNSCPTRISYLNYAQSDGAFSPEKGGYFNGTAVGAEIVPEEGATRVLSLDVNGTFDPVATSTWQAVAAGSWIGTGAFVDMANTTDGRSVLDALNIPCIQVGRVDLTGSGNNLTVNMNDVNFYARSTGGDPQIWATKNVSGSYSAAPTLNTPITLNSTSGGTISAGFTPVRWDSGKWGATVSGVGTLNGLSGGGGYNGFVQFQGGAAGSYTGTGSGSFSGSGAGTAKAVH